MVAREHEATGCKYHTAGAGRTPSRLSRKLSLAGSDEGFSTAQLHANLSPAIQPRPHRPFYQCLKEEQVLMELLLFPLPYKTWFTVAVCLEAGELCLNLGINAFLLTGTLCADSCESVPAI